MDDWKYPKHLKLERKARDKQERADVKDMWVAGSMFGKRGGTITWYIAALPHLLQKQLDEAHAAEMAHMQNFYDELLAAKRIELGLPPDA